MSLARLDDEQRLLAARSASLTARIVRLEREVDHAVVPPEALGEADRAVRAAEVIVAAHEQVALLAPERDVVQGEHESAVRRLLDAREHLLDLRERRIAGMAAELA